MLKTIICDILTLKFNERSVHFMPTDISQLSLPDGQVITDPQTLNKYGQNKYTQEVMEAYSPLAIVEAHSYKDVQETLKYANENKIPVTPYGNGTSIVNSSAGENGGIVLDLSKLNKIIDINIPNQYAVVQAGVLNGDLDTEARKQGYFFAPDPGSKPISSVGGNIATNAGGMSSLKYGTIKQSVLETV